MAIVVQLIPMVKEMVRGMERGILNHHIMDLQMAMKKAPGVGVNMDLMELLYVIMTILTKVQITLMYMNGRGGIVSTQAGLTHH